MLESKVARSPHYRKQDLGLQCQTPLSDLKLFGGVVLLDLVTGVKQSQLLVLRLRMEFDKNYETYNNERKEQVFASSSKFQIKRFI